MRFRRLPIRRSFFQPAVVSLVLLVLRLAGFGAETPLPEDVRFVIGDADGRAAELGLVDEGYARFLSAFPEPVRFTVGTSSPSVWPFVHPAPRDTWAGARTHTFTVTYASARDEREELYLILGLCGAHGSQRSRVVVSVNGRELPAQRAPAGFMGVVFDPLLDGEPQTMTFPLPRGAIHRGENAIAIRLEDESWIVYDYVALRGVQQPLAIVQPSVSDELFSGPAASARRVVFAVRKPGADGHWYANFGHYSVEKLGRTYFSSTSDGGRRVAYRQGGRLCTLDVKTGDVTVLLDDPLGGVRDPVVHYDGERILFSYRKGDSTHYHLHEIGADGLGLRQLTDGDFDDIEPCYLPDGDIVFVSSRCKRWVNCWVTEVAVLHRCDGDGGNIRAISSNIEHDNTPWVLPDGRLLYQRWEYVDRSQVDYHHLWTSYPDGTGQTVFYGNQKPGTVMIDAKPIAGTEKIVSIFSPGHGQREHDGALVVVDPRVGPDDPSAVRTILSAPRFRDPWALSEDAFLVASGAELIAVDGRGRRSVLYRLSDDDVREGYECHEPRPLAPRPRERILPSRARLDQGTGTLVLARAHEGRNMEGVRPGEIRKLLVLETLPKPINFTGGMDPLTYGGSFTLERVVGTVPVEPDGSAYFELPALRSFFFVALDEDDLSVKRMQSFVTVQPGEQTGCVGCHEQRTLSVPLDRRLLATHREPSRVEPIPDCPDVFDFPRDVQPILDELCNDCHGYEKTARGGPYAGRLILSGDRGPMFSHSYYLLTVRNLFSDGRNLPRSNYAPRSIGSSASRILRMLDGSHYDVQATEHQKRMLRLWIEVGAPYPGTYAALGSGSIGGYLENIQRDTDFDWPTTQAAAEVIDRRCASCHQGPKVLPRALSDEKGLSFWRPDWNDPRLEMSRHIVFNLTRPEKSLILVAPLAKAAGGFGICGGASGPPIFTSPEDEDYGKLLDLVVEGKRYLDRKGRFDAPGFRPLDGYVREMKRYGILPADLADDAAIDLYATDRAYWESLWYRPAAP